VATEKKATPKRLTAWRNAMVSAINAGLEQGLFGLKEGENNFSERGGVYGFDVGGIPAKAGVNDIGYGELRVSVALWPVVDGLNINVGNPTDCCPRDAPGDLVAVGFLERRLGAWLQTSAAGGGSLFCRRHRLAEASAIKVKPNGYKDSGKLIL
jgi:hypothetical protein